MAASYTRAQGYPQRGIKDGAEEIVDRVYGAPGIYSEFTIGQPYDNGAAVLSSIKTSLDPSGTLEYVDLTYSPSGATPPPVDSNLWDVSASGNTQQEPISTHPDYRYKWDHYLAVKNGTTSGIAAGLYDDSTAKEHEINEEARETYRWIHYSEPCPDGWYAPDAYKATKPGIDSYLKPAPIITESALFSSSLKAGQMMQDIGTKKTPAKTFGLPTEATNPQTETTEGTFLLISAEIQPDGKRWRVTRQFQYSPNGWDGDIYT